LRKLVSGCSVEVSGREALPWLACDVKVDSTVQARSHGGSETFQIFLCPPNFVVPRKNCFKQIMKAKDLPPKLYFLPQTSKPVCGPGPVARRNAHHITFCVSEWSGSFCYVVSRWLNVRQPALMKLTCWFCRHVDSASSSLITLQWKQVTCTMFTVRSCDSFRDQSAIFSRKGLKQHSIVKSGNPRAVRRFRLATKNKVPFRKSLFWLFPADFLCRDSAVAGHVARQISSLQ